MQEVILLLPVHMRYVGTYSIGLFLPPKVSPDRSDHIKMSLQLYSYCNKGKELLLSPEIGGIYVRSNLGDMIGSPFEFDREIKQKRIRSV